MQHGLQTARYTTWALITAKSRMSFGGDLTSGIATGEASEHGCTGLYVPHSCRRRHNQNRYRARLYGEA